MSATEWLQLAALAAGACVVGYAIYRWVRKLDAVFPDTAKHFGLSYTRERRGSAFTNLLETSRLRGVTGGTPIEAVATYQTRGRMRMRSTVVSAPAPAQLPRFALNLARRAPAATVHLVPTGDPDFDSRCWVTSDAPAGVRALLTPEVRAAVLRCPQYEMHLVAGDGQLVLSCPGTPTSRAELQGPMDVVLAAARIGAP